MNNESLLALGRLVFALDAQAMATRGPIVGADLDRMHDRAVAVRFAGAFEASISDPGINLVELAGNEARALLLRLKLYEL